MNKKKRKEKHGLSPLIATVIIIGMTVAIGAGVQLWGAEFVKNIQQNSERMQEITKACTATTTTITKINQTTPGKLSFTLENTGQQNIEKLIIRTKGTKTTKSQEKIGLTKADKKTYYLTINPTETGIIEELEIITAIRLQNKIIICTESINTETEPTQDEIDSWENTTNTCGNEIIDAAWEQCEGTNLQEQSCITLEEGYNGGILTCNTDCTYDTTQCTTPEPPVQTCTDGTNYSSCSTTKPLYCDNNNLISNCNICGCPDSIIIALTLNESKEYSGKLITLNTLAPGKAGIIIGHITGGGYYKLLAPGETSTAYSITATLQTVTENTAEITLTSTIPNECQEDGTCAETSIPQNCGNNIIEGTETCDGWKLQNKTCVGEGYDEGILVCDNNCQLDYSGCRIVNETRPVCGNNIIEEYETCDDGNRNNCDGCSSTCLIETENACGTPEGLKLLENNCLIDSGKLYCWNSWGKDEWGPIAIRLASSLNAITSASEGIRNCAVNSGELYCWNYNVNTQQYESPTLIDLPEVTQVITESFSICAISSGKVYCWGENDRGQLGIGNLEITNSDTPLFTGIQNAVKLNIHNDAVCALDTNGNLYCWGWNYASRFTSPEGIISAPTQVSTSNIEDFAIGFYQLCFITEGTLQCRGRNDYGEFGIGSKTFLTQHTTPVTSSMTNPETIEAGTGYTCASNNEGYYCWGHNVQGWLGDGTTTDKLVPTKILMANPTELQVGTEANTCARNNSGAYCWGSNILGPNQHSSYPVKIIIETQPPTENTCSEQGGDICLETEYCPSWMQLNTSDTDRCCSESCQEPTWNTCDACGQGLFNICDQNECETIPEGCTYTDELIGGICGVTVTHTLNKTQGQVSLGITHSCYTNKNGELYCWGLNTYGQLGDGTTTQREIPTQVTGIPPVAKVAVGTSHTCASTTQGVYCWGEGTKGQLGDGTGQTNYVPTKAMNAYVKDISAGVYRTCAVTTSEELYCWGDNTQGALGDGTTTNKKTPTKISLTNVKQISAFTSHMCALTDNKMFCWGYNEYGQLGDGTTTRRETPIETLITNPTKMSVGHFTTCASTTQGVYCWGFNKRGQIADGTTENRLTPTLSTQMESTEPFALGQFSSCATNNTGLYCWGLNTYGQLGDGTTTLITAPTNTNHMTNPREISSGFNHVCATNNTGLYCWGKNTYGQLGDGTTTDQPSPVLINL